MASLGEGIGLQDKPNLFAGIAANRLAAMDAAEARKEMARQKAQEKDDNAFNKVISDKDVHLDPKMWEKPFISAASAEYKDWLNKAIQTRKDNPNNWLPAIQQSIVELNDHISHLKNGNDILRQHIKDVQDGKIHSDPNMLKKLYETDYTDVHKDPDTGAWVSSAWNDIKPDPVYGFTFDGKGNVSYKPVQRFDFQGKNQGFLNDANVWTSSGTRVKPLQGAPNLFEKVETKIVDPIQREQYIKTIVQNPEAVRSWIVMNKDAVQQSINSDPSFATDPNKIIEVMRSSLRDDLSGKRSTSSSFVDRPPQEKGADKKEQVVSINPTGRTLNVGVTYNVKNEGSLQKESGNYEDTKGNKFYLANDGKYYNQDKESSVKTPVGEVTFHPSQSIQNITSQGTAEFSPVDIQTAPEYHIDMETGKGEKIAGATKYQINGVEKLPYATDPKTGKIILIPDYVTEKYTKEKGYNIKTGWFATGLEKAGMQNGEMVTKPRAIPLTKQVMDQLSAKKVKIEGLDSAELFGEKGAKQPTAVKEKEVKPKEDKAQSLRSKYGY